MASSHSKSRSHDSGASASRTTTDHQEIRRWAEERGGSPACVKGTGDSNDPGLLRIDFPGYSGEESLQHIDWDEWFDKFDCAHLALLYEDRMRDGQPSRFNKLIDRGTASDSRKHGRSAK